MLIHRISAQPRSLERASASPQEPQPVTGDPPQEHAPRDYVLPAAAGVVVGAGLGYAGLYAGAHAGLMLGLLATSPEAGLGQLLDNLILGARIGAVTGAASFGLTGGLLAGLGVWELLHPQPEAEGQAVAGAASGNR